MNEKEEMKIRLIRHQTQQARRIGNRQIWEEFDILEEECVGVEEDLFRWWLDLEESKEWLVLDESERESERWFITLRVVES